MKKLFLISVLLASQCFALEPLSVNNNGELQPPNVQVLKNGKTVTFPTGIAIGASTMGLGADVYIAIRTDGKPGSGTKLDPYDASGSTPAAAAVKLDAVWAAFTGPAHFYYAKGDYYASGWDFVTRRTAYSGWQHTGEGMLQTTIHLTGCSTVNCGFIFGTNDTGVRVDDFTVEDMKLEADATLQPKWTGTAPGVSTNQTGCVKVHGSRNKMRRVWFDGFGDKGTGETFPVHLTDTNVAGDYSDNLVEDCLATSSVTGSSGTTLSVIYIGANRNGNTGSNNVIRGTTINVSGSDASFKQGFNADLIENSTVTGATRGVYHEPNPLDPGGVLASAPIARLTCKHVIFKSCNSAVTGAAVPSAVTDKGIILDGCEIIDCNRLIETFGNSGDGLGSGGGTHVYFDHVEVRNSKFYKSDGTVSTAQPFQVLAAHNVILQNNELNSSSSTAVNVYADAAPIVENNHKPDGTLLPYYLSSALTSQKAGVLTDVVGNITLPGNVNANGGAVITGDIFSQTLNADKPSAINLSSSYNMPASGITRHITHVATGTATYTVTGTDYMVMVTPHTGGTTVTLPAGFDNACFYIIDEGNSSGTDNITINTSSSQTFTTTGTSKTIATNGKGMRIIWTGTTGKWHATLETGL